jgi:uncharacterized protein
MNETSTLLTFPCEFPIKLMGLASVEFEGAVTRIIRKHIPDIGEAAFRLRYSANGKYLAYTVTILATSQALLDAIYQECTANEYILMAL